MIPAASGSYPRRDGNLVRPLIGGRGRSRRIAEAVDAARERVWLTVAFYADDFHLPDGRGLFELLESAAARGVDVRALFWRPNPDSINYGRVFDGPLAERLAAEGALGQRGRAVLPSPEELDGRRHRLRRRHQPHRQGARAPRCLSRGERSVGGRRRAQLRRSAGTARRERDPSEDLPLPSEVFAPCGPSTVQIQRMFRDDRSILEQYELAIDAAERSIYIENQAIPIPRLAAAPRQGAGARRRCPVAGAGDSGGGRLCRATGSGTARPVRRAGGARPASEFPPRRHLGPTSTPS